MWYDLGRRLGREREGENVVWADMCCYTRERERDICKYPICNNCSMAWHVLPHAVRCHMIERYCEKYIHHLCIFRLRQWKPSVVLAQEQLNRERESTIKGSGCRTTWPTLILVHYLLCLKSAALLVLQTSNISIVLHGLSGSHRSGKGKLRV